MPSPGELLSRGFSMGGKVKNAELAAIAAGINASGHYSRRGNNRRTNEAKAQAMLKWYTNAEAKGKEGGKAFQTRRNFARNLAAALAVSPSGSRASSRGSNNNNLEKVFLAAGKPAPAPAASRKASRASPSKKPSATRKASRNAVPHLNFHGPGGANVHGLSYKEKYPPAQGTWPMLKKDGHVWQVKVVPGKGNTAFVSKLWGKVGGKMEASQKLIKGGKAGRSAQQEATHEAELAHEKKKEDDGYTEVRSVHRGSNNELKSINNFVVGK